MKRRKFIQHVSYAPFYGSVIPMSISLESFVTKELDIGKRKQINSENIIFPRGANMVIDVTKPPYNCDNTGREDCTKALIKALDDHLIQLQSVMLVPKLEVEQNNLVRFTNRGTTKGGGANVMPTRILYFPNGIYQVSDTICYSFDDLNNFQYNELNRQIIIRGQSEEGTIIRLHNSSPGFEAGANKPVLSIMRGTQSNVSMANYVENITIDTGKGNPGASGLRFFSNNTGAARNLTIRSGNPDKSGAVGLLCDMFNLSGSFFKDITIDGFDYGVQVLPNRMYAVFENINLRNQKIVGFLVDENPVSIRRLRSDNQVPALKLTGIAGHVVLLDSELKMNATNKNNISVTPAIEHNKGVLFIRNVTTSGYECGIGNFGKRIFGESYIKEFSSHGTFTIFENQERSSLNLPIEETPMIPWEQDMDQWVSVNDFGARGDGKTDDTQFIQNALNSGKRIIYFQTGQYLINGQISVPKTVERINFMFCDLISGTELSNSDIGTFRITEESDVPLIIEDLFAFAQFRGQHYLVDHASKRTLILSDLHVQSAGIYFNSVSGGKVYIENNACRRSNGTLNGFKFLGQKVWARQLNPENSNPQVINVASQLWVLGFKTEGKGVGFHTSNQGSTEILGGTPNIGGQDNPFIVNDESSVSAICAANCWRNTQVFNDFALEKRNGILRYLNKDGMPKRILFHGGHITSQRDYYVENYFIPLYVGKVNKKIQ